MGFSSEKEKIEFEHKLKIRRIILDKLLLGVVFIILGITTNTVLEKYKGNLTSGRFFLEKKYDCALLMQEAMAIFLKQYEEFTADYKKADLSKNYLKPFINALNDFSTTINKSYLLFSEDFGRSTQYLMLVFNGIAHKDVSKLVNYRAYVYDVLGWFHDNLVRELGLKLNYKKENYPFTGIDNQLALRTDASKFIDKEFEKWNKWRKNNHAK
jgi:hypothetical protein